MSSLSAKIKNNFTPSAISSFANSIWMIIRGPVTLLMIPLFLSETAQGYWYTFGSLAALSTLADLGFTMVVGQFSAHEYAHLVLNKQGKLEGDTKYLERIVSLFRFVFKWTVVVTLIAFPIIMIIGGFVLNTHGNMGDWIVPWILFSAFSGANFIIGTVFSFFEGCNQIGKIQRNKLIGSMVVTFSTWIMLALKFNLYTLAFSAILGVLVNVILLIIKFRKTLYQLFKHQLEKQYKWLKEFMGLMWKYAISWGSGYLIFQIFTPIVFMVYDPVQAGKVGITLTLAQACFGISSVWLNISTPKMNMMAAKADWKSMDRLLYKITILSMVTAMIGVACILGGYAIFEGRISILNRFLGLVPMSIIVVAYFLQLPINSIALYGRAHKEEPFIIHSVIQAVITVGLTLFVAFNLSIDYIFLGILTSTVIIVFAFIYEYIKNKNKWHERYTQRFLDSNNENEELKENNS